MCKRTTIQTQKELIINRMKCNDCLIVAVGNFEYEFTFKPYLDELYKKDKKVYQIIIELLSTHFLNDDLFNASIELITVMASIKRANK